MFSFFKTQATQKILALLLLAILLVAIPLTVWYGQKQQQTQQKASTKIWNSGYDSCGHILVVRLSETPDCASQIANINSYYTTVSVKSVDGNSYTIHAVYETFWCKNQGELGDNFGDPYACVKRPVPLIKDYPVNGSGVSIQAPTRSPADGFSYCGTFQNDFSFTYTDRNGTSCHFGYPTTDPIASHQVVADGYCTTEHVNCSAVTPTISPTPTNTPTPTSGITPTDTPTPTTPVTPTDTPTPTVTTTPGPSDTPTPTNNPSVTPTPTTPVVATSTPKPTLPPTGPGNLVIGIGLIGAVAAVIGTVVILAL